MSGIKRRAADKHFSNCVRCRANWACERCGKYYPEGMRMALHCSHFFGRGKWSTRFDPKNCEALCYGCHMYVTAHPEEHRQEKISRIGQEEFDKLSIKAYSSILGKKARKSERQISKHYLAEFKLLERKRNNGDQDRIEFSEYILI